MKKPLGAKIIGFILIVFSIIGLLFSFSGIIAAWVVRPRIRDSVSEILLTFEDALSTSQEGFSLMDQAIEGLIIDFEIIEESFEGLNTTLDGVTDSLDTSSNLIGDDLKQTVIDTQTALNSSASTAEIIDNTLSFLARLPLIGVDYAPEVPLHISLNQVADNLDQLPTTLETIEEGINQTTGGLESLQTNLLDLSDQIQDFKDDLENSQIVLGKFNDSIDVLVSRVTSLNENLGTYLTLCCLFISGILFWLGLAQLVVLNQGYVFLNNEPIFVKISDIQRK